VRQVGAGRQNFFLIKNLYCLRTATRWC